MTRPRRAVVVSAGVVGLSTAWFLQEHDIEVTVVDQVGVAAGASRGNAGWITPGWAVPLTEPAALRAGLASMLTPNSTFFAVSPRSGPSTWWFLARLAAHCTPRRWERARSMLAALNEKAFRAYDTLARAGVVATPVDEPLIAAFTRPEHASHLHAGDLETLSLADARGLVPLLSDQVTHAVRINGTRYLHPALFVEALATSFTQRGGVIAVERVTGIDPAGQVETESGTLRADVAVIATGAAIGRLARPLGVRGPVRAGRGHSFTVATDLPNDHPIYLPHQRITCTPDGGRVRLTSTMEFGPPSAASRARRIDAIVRRASPLLTGIDWTQRNDEWSGDRPVTSDGLPIIGATRIPNVYVAGGHAMWGMTQGPASGQLLARFVATGTLPDVLKSFDPLR